METILEDGLEPVKMPKVAPTIVGAEGDWCHNSHLSTEQLTPLEDRLAVQRPILCEGLGKLRQLLGANRYEKYIGTLPNLTRNGSMVLIVAHDVMQRSMIERECIPYIKKAFGVTRVQVVG